MPHRASDEIRYQYSIAFDDAKTISFDIRLDHATLNNDLDLGPPPDWATRRAFGCVNPSCPLKPDDPCPCARTIHHLLGVFGNVHSTQMVSITATTRQRVYAKRAAIQTAVGSIAGILMPTCGCPVLARFKPMARFHLPFASLEETEYRVFSMYALAQCFRGRQRLERDEGLGGLRQFYQEIQDVNRLAARKICALQQNDATINGLVMLDAFALKVSMSIEADDLEHVEKLFADWLK